MTQSQHANESGSHLPSTYIYLYLPIYTCALTYPGISNLPSTCVHYYPAGALPPFTSGVLYRVVVLCRWHAAHHPRHGLPHPICPTR